jgi:hypothetical protein
MAQEGHVTGVPGELEFARHTEIIASKRILPSLEYVEGGLGSRAIYPLVNPTLLACMPHATS